jgi:hypothetical protein
LKKKFTAQSTNMMLAKTQRRSKQDKNETNHHILKHSACKHEGTGNAHVNARAPNGRGTENCAPSEFYIQDSKAANATSSQANSNLEVDAFGKNGLSGAGTIVGNETVVVKEITGEAGLFTSDTAATEMF